MSIGQGQDGDMTALLALHCRRKKGDCQRMLVIIRNKSSFDGVADRLPPLVVLIENMPAFHGGMLINDQHGPLKKRQFLSTRLIAVQQPPNGIAEPVWALIPAMGQQRIDRDMEPAIAKGLHAARYIHGWQNRLFSQSARFPVRTARRVFAVPEWLRNCMRGRVVNRTVETRVMTDGDEATTKKETEMGVVLSSITDHRQQLLNAKRFIIVACGTSWHAGLIGKQMIENYCRVPVEVEYASEFRYRNPVVTSDDVVIAISQSGETADTLAAIKLAKEKGAFIYGICNSIGSSIARETDTGTYIHVGPEIGVASTKAFTGQVTVLTLLALAIGNEKGTISADDYQNITEQLWNIPEKMKEVLKLNNKIADLSRTFTYARNFIYLGRGFQYPVALEGALKLKEISYIHAEGYPAAEMKHGPIALIDSDMPVVVIATHNFMYEKVLSNIQEIKARQGRVIAIVSNGDETISKIADEVIELPETLECLEPLLATIPLQLLAYHVAVCKGKDVDQPRNLAKSVTVE